MKWMRSAVTTAIAALPVKLVKYRMLDRVVTIRASTPARAHAARTASCRRLSAGLGACDMDRCEQLLEGSDRGECVRTFFVHCPIEFDRGHFRDRDRSHCCAGR